MINVSKMFSEALKFVNQSMWEQKASELGYTIQTDVLPDDKSMVTLVAISADGDSRGFYMCYLNNHDVEIRGFLVEKPMCECGHNHG